MADSENTFARPMEPIFPKDVKYPFITEDTETHKRVGAKSLRHIPQTGFESIFDAIKFEKKKRTKQARLAGTRISFMHLTTIASAHLKAREEGISAISLVQVKPMPEIETVSDKE